ncbi:unnamed protein product [Allacma fusca]|uniref:Uncharacterized protein n=1 Tax=Allacma fusca TaxID=39272 RepID=A0A8J2KNA8_9HEXA|nr:unnamed protein product [Allacma fusca]
MDKILKFLWVSWPYIESITLTSVKVSAVAHNLDSIFCGISKEKASSYESRSANQLESVVLTCEQPSIMALTRLKKFRVELIHRQRCHRIRTKDSHRFFVTHVTAALAFARMPGLTVEVLTDVCQRKSVSCGYAFKHLEPFWRCLEHTDFQTSAFIINISCILPPMFLIFVKRKAQYFLPQNQTSIS